MRASLIRNLCRQVNRRPQVFLIPRIHRFYATNLGPSDTFEKRHQYLPEDPKVKEMLNVVGAKDLEDLTRKIVPQNIYNPKGLNLGDTTVRGETDVLEQLKGYAKMNVIKKSFIGMGYYGTVVPNVIIRNMIEDPGWYTAYTPYQAEISQGRLESLLNYQTVISDLTGFPIANASLLDEATACAEAMFMCYREGPKTNQQLPFFVSDKVHPQNIEVIKTRAKFQGINVIVGDINTHDFEKDKVAGVLIQYPDTEGNVVDYEAFTKRIHDNGGLVVASCDLLALTVLKPPAEFGADIAVGTNQRFGVPLGYGGPHAGYMATTDKLKRTMPGRIIGISKDNLGNRAYRMALQTREQHIRRERATSNICTAQALLANVSAMYAVYHGPEGLKNIASTVHEKAVILQKGLKKLGYKTADWLIFDTVKVTVDNADKIMKNAEELGYNLRKIDNNTISISLDETTLGVDLNNLFKAFNDLKPTDFTAEDIAKEDNNIIETSNLKRTSKYLQHKVFNSYHTEHELLRYMNRLKSRDLSMTTSMITLGSCTMKLNATTEMIPITWPEFANIHPFVPLEQAKGYQKLFKEFEAQLCEITGFDACSLQPNSGAQGEYTGLACIRSYLDSIGQGHRNVCLIPASAHGTNPASAAMLGMKIVVVKCDNKGNIDVQDLKKQAEANKDNLAALMVTYPSTHGVFESSISEICDIVHQYGGQVYMDGANMNAQVGLTSPGRIGADVCHLNLHKTFCIPHGGGGPGMGPICVKKHLAPFLPNSAIVPGVGGENSIGSVSAAPWGSASILPISWVYITLMGSQGLRRATQMAILNANYMAKRLEGHYKIVYTGESGYNAHEFIIDIRPFKKTAGIEAEDIAKRLMDYGFHAPTMSFPIANTLMIEPTESESKEELDRFIDALISIRKEIALIEEGKLDKQNNPLKNAPHTAQVVTAEVWDKPYSREVAAFPAPWIKEHKHWPYVGRIDGAYGDRNLCACLPVEEYVNN